MQSKTAPVVAGAAAIIDHIYDTTDFASRMLRVLTHCRSARRNDAAPHRAV